MFFNILNSIIISEFFSVLLSIFKYFCFKQNRLRSADGLSRAESIQRLDYLKQHLLDLERQYEKSKPLVNLVDNMVKLGSLYRNDANGGKIQRPEAVTLDRLEFNQRIQEKRLLQEEQKQWDRLNPDHSELQVS